MWLSGDKIGNIFNALGWGTNMYHTKVMYTAPQRRHVVALEMYSTFTERTGSYKTAAKPLTGQCEVSYCARADGHRTAADVESTGTVVLQREHRRPRAAAPRFRRQRCGGTGGSGGSGGSSGTGGSPGGTRPCDIYAAANNTCVAAHSTIRALFAAYSGNLYQVRRADGMTRDIPVKSPGGFADSAQQESFCSGSTCTIWRVYDQSGRGNFIEAQTPTSTVGGRQGMTAANAAAERWNFGGNKVYSVYTRPPAYWRDPSVCPSARSQGVTWLRRAALQRRCVTTTATRKQGTYEEATMDLLFRQLHHLGKSPAMPFGHG